MSKSDKSQSKNIFFEQPLFSGITSLLFLVIVTFFAIRDQSVPPGVIPASSPDTEFSAERARSHLKEITRDIHPVGSEAHQQVREYIIRELESMGLEPEVHSTTGVHYFRGYRASEVHNILVKIPGTNSTGGIGLMAHYDSTPHSYGATDAGNGVAAIMETARVLLESEPLKNDLFLLITDAEETGLIGSQAFIDEHPWFGDLTLVMNFEGRGDSGPALMFRTVGGENGELIRTLARHSPDAVAASFSNEILRILPNDTDLSNFRDAGVLGMDFANIAGVQHYHTSQDNFENADPRSLQHHGNYILSLSHAFGNRDLTELKSPNLIYFNIPAFGMIYYPERFAIPLAIVTFLFISGVMAAGFRKKKLTAKGTILSFIAYPLMMALLALIAHGIWTLLSSSFSGIAVFQFFGPHNSGYYLAGIFLLVFAGFLTIHLIMKKWFTVADIAAAPLLLWVLFGTTLSFIFPGLSYLFIWPAIFTGAAFLFHFSDPFKNSLVTFTGILLSGAAVITILAPTVWHMEVILTIIAIGPLTVLFCTVLGFLVLQLDLSVDPLRLKLPALLAAASLLLITTGIATSGLSGENRKPNGVNYFANLDEEKAFWYSPDIQADWWTTQFLDDEPDLIYASEFEFDDTGAALLGARLDLPLMINEAPLQKDGIPAIEVLSDSLTENGRRFSIRLSPQPGTYNTELFLPEINCRKRSGSMAAKSAILMKWPQNPLPYIS
jgi:hypothetical protein